MPFLEQLKILYKSLSNYGFNGWSFRRLELKSLSKSEVKKNSVFIWNTERKKSINHLRFEGLSY